MNGGKQFYTAISDVKGVSSLTHVWVCVPVSQQYYAQLNKLSCSVVCHLFLFMLSLK